MSTARNAAAVEACFAALVAAAVAGVRCPENGTHGIEGSLVSELCRQGRVRSEISHRNYRQVHILAGEHVGACTAPPPGGAQPWLVVGRSTMRHGRAIAGARAAGSGKPFDPAAKYREVF